MLLLICKFCNTFFSGGQGASGDPCDETYYGPHAFSEPETAAIRNFILARKDSMKVNLIEYLFLVKFH